jgi:hypothetical protein
LSPGSVCRRTLALPSRRIFTSEARPAAFACSLKLQSVGALAKAQKNAADPGTPLRAGRDLIDLGVSPAREPVVTGELRASRTRLNSALFAHPWSRLFCCSSAAFAPLARNLFTAPSIVCQIGVEVAMRDKAKPTTRLTCLPQGFSNVIPVRHLSHAACACTVKCTGPGRKQRKCVFIMLG